MSRRWVKTYAALLDSSVYTEPASTRVLWEAMRLEADRLGIVRHTVGSLARRAKLTEPEVAAGLRFLASPDPTSRDTAEAGRRILEIPEGWRIVNHDKHQSGTSSEQKEFARIRSQRYRARKRASRVTRDAASPVTNECASRVSVTTLDLDLNQKLLDPSRDIVTHDDNRTRAREAMHLARIAALLDGTLVEKSGSPEEAEKRDERKREPGASIQ